MHTVPSHSTTHAGRQSAPKPLPWKKRAADIPRFPEEGTHYNFLHLRCHHCLPALGKEASGQIYSLKVTRGLLWRSCLPRAEGNHPGLLYSQQFGLSYCLKSFFSQGQDSAWRVIADGFSDVGEGDIRYE